MIHRYRNLGDMSSRDGQSRTLSLSSLYALASVVSLCSLRNAPKRKKLVTTRRPDQRLPRVKGTTKQTYSTIPAQKSTISKRKNINTKTYFWNIRNLFLTKEILSSINNITYFGYIAKIRLTIIDSIPNRKSEPLELLEEDDLTITHSELEEPRRNPWGDATLADCDLGSFVRRKIGPHIRNRARCSSRNRQSNSSNFELRASHSQHSQSTQTSERILQQASKNRDWLIRRTRSGHVYGKYPM